MLERPRKLIQTLLAFVGHFSLSFKHISLFHKNILYLVRPTIIIVNLDLVGTSGFGISYVQFWYII